MLNYNINYKKVQGLEAADWMTELARLRIEIFKEWPYIYDGNIDYEVKYLSRYIQAENSMILMAFDDKKLIGATTCILLAEESDPEIVKPFIAKGFDPNNVVYYGESILKKDYRGLGIGKKFMQYRENFARSLPGITHVAFCSVVRPDQHHLKPQDYIPLNDFWKKQGFSAVPEMTCVMRWQDIYDTTETKKELQFWLKLL